MTRRTRVLGIIGALALSTMMCYTIFRSDCMAGIAEVRYREVSRNFERSNGDCDKIAYLTPIRAFSYSIMTMAEKTCKHMIAMCAITHLPCSHAKFDGECKQSECVNESFPTYRQMADIYLEVKPNISHKGRSIILPTMKRLAETIGHNLDSKVVLGINEWELIYKRLTDGSHPFAHEGGYDPATIKQWFSIFTRCAGAGDKAVRMQYTKLGLRRPDCDLIPDVDYSTKERKIEELTGSQIDIVMDEMTRLRNSSKNADRRRFVWMWFALYFGVRPADICRLKWDCIKSDPDGGKRIEYIPHKTDGKTGGRVAAGRIHPKLMRWIEPYVGAAEEYVIERKSQHTARKTKRHGTYEGGHRTIQEWVNGFMRNKVGVKGHMAGYLLRRDCSKWTLEHKGSLAETVLLGHTATVRDTNYVNRGSINIRRMDNA